MFFSFSLVEKENVIWIEKKVDCRESWLGFLRAEIHGMELEVSFKRDTKSEVEPLCKFLLEWHFFSFFRRCFLVSYNSIDLIWFITKRYMSKLK